MKKEKNKSRRKISDYDNSETASFIDQSKQLKFEDIGLELPETPPTQVVSIRLSSQLLNELKALGSQQDDPIRL